MTTDCEIRLLRDIKDIGLLPEGQRKSVIGLVGGKRARTYIEASIVAGMSLGTLHTHLKRIRTRHPRLHRAIYKERKAQLKVRHREGATGLGTIPRNTSSVYASGSGGWWVGSEGGVQAYEAVVR